MTEDQQEQGSLPAAERLAHEIRRLRVAANMSQKELARQIVYTRQYVALAERTDQNVPSMGLVHKLDETLNAGGTLISLRAQAKAEQAKARRRTTGPRASDDQQSLNLSGRVSKNDIVSTQLTTPRHVVAAQNLSEDGPIRPTRYSPNTRLTWERLQRGWSRQELVHQIKVSMGADNERSSGLTADTARRWESGERWPEPRYRKHLVRIFGLSAAELGLLTRDELKLRPSDRVAEDNVSRTEMGRDGARILADLWMMMQHDSMGMKRQAFLRTLLAVSAPHLLAPIAAASDAVTHPLASAHDPRTVASYAQITAAQRSLYWASPPASLLQVSLAHTRLGAEILGTSGMDTRSARKLASAVAESALLSARLAFFDLGHVEVAQQAFMTANDAVNRAQDSALAVAVTAHQAFIPGFVGDVPAAQKFLDVAQAHVRYAGGPRLRAWLHCVTAEVHARLGVEVSIRDRIRQAQEALTTSGTDPVWLDFFDASRLAGFAGNAELLTGHHRAASSWLQQALAGLDATQAKQRAVLLFDLACAEAHSDVSRAADFAHQGCTALESDFYVTAFERVPDVRSALSGTMYAAELEDRMRSLSVVGPGTSSKTI